MKALWLALVLGGCARETPVLLYHAVGCGTASPRDVPLAEFVDALDAVRKAGFSFVSAAQAVDPGAHLPPKAVALTFDDGAECIFTQAFPALRERRIPFTVFVPTAWMRGSHVQDAGDGVIWPTLSVDELRALTDSGLAEVGVHGLDHRDLHTLSPEEERREIVEARVEMERLLHAAPRLFAYPFGAFDRRDVTLVREAGYAGAFSVNAGMGGRYGHRRASVFRGLNGAQVVEMLRGSWVLAPLANG